MLTLLGYETLCGGISSGLTKMRFGNIVHKTKVRSPSQHNHDSRTYDVEYAP